MLFDRICRENGITHRLTAPRSHHDREDRTLPRHVPPRVPRRPDLSTLAAAQVAVDAWVHEYNHDRPHQSIGRCTPAERFATRTSDDGPALDLSALEQRRVGEDWVSRKVASNGVVCVAWQQISVGKHRHGEHVDVHVGERLLQIWSGNELLRTIARESTGEVRKKRAGRPRT